jgi:vancomycin resistance protein VanJ
MSDAPAPASRSGAVLRALATAALAVVGVSLVVRFTVRDRVPGVATIYYATPLVVDALAAAVAATLAWRARRRRTAALCALVALACGALYLSTSFVRNETRTPGAIRGVFWNVEHGDRGRAGVVETLRALDADVAWLTEVDDGDAAFETLLADAFPGRARVHAKGGIEVIARGEATLLERTSLRRASRMALFRVVVDGHVFESLHVDVASTPTIPRPPTLDRVREHVASRPPGPILVLGDFNTPRDSVGFDAWRGPFAHAFETAGRGLDATWPVPVPALALDHVWAGGGVAVRTCEIPWTWRSDHLPIVFTFDIE